VRTSPGFISSQGLKESLAAKTLDFISIMFEELELVPGAVLWLLVIMWLATKERKDESLYGPLKNVSPSPLR